MRRFPGLEFLAHIGVDLGSGYTHSVTATPGNVHDLDEAAHLVRADDRVVYADAGYQGADKRPETAGDDPVVRSSGGSRPVRVC